MDGQEILGMSDFLAQMGTLQESAAAASTDGSQNQTTVQVAPAAETQGTEAEGQEQGAAQEQAAETAPATEVTTEAATQPAANEANSLLLVRKLQFLLQWNQTNQQLSPQRRLLKLHQLTTRHSTIK